MAAQDDANAILALLRAVPDLTVWPPENGATVTGKGIVPPGSPRPYVAVHLHTERTSGGRLDNRSTRRVTRAFCHCVGDNDIAARAVADLVAGALLDVRPTIDGRSCYPIRHDASQPARPDESTGDTVVDLVDVYRLESMPG
jgi:hypothetical protein